MNNQDKHDVKWGCLPILMIIVGCGLVPTPLLPIGILLIIAGASMAGYSIKGGD